MDSVPRPPSTRPPNGRATASALSYISVFKEPYMPATTCREIRLKSRPKGMPATDTFELAETVVQPPSAGQFVVRNIWMSVDPYMRRRMREGKSYIPPFEIGQPLSGGCVGQVVESKHDRFAAGEYVLGMQGWREYWVSDGQGVTKIDPGLAPIQTYLGTLGLPGLTAYVGLLEIGKLNQGETVFVSAAAGAVGSVACQIAKIKGCRVIGSAGSDEKLAWLRQEAGVEHTINYKLVGDLAAELDRLCPQGIDLYY